VPVFLLVNKKNLSLLSNKYPLSILQFFLLKFAYTTTLTEIFCIHRNTSQTILIVDLKLSNSNWTINCRQRF